jgi:hypothetical protein
VTRRQDRLAVDGTDDGDDAGKKRDRTRASESYRSRRIADRSGHNSGHRRLRTTDNGGAVRARRAGTPPARTSTTGHSNARRVTGLVRVQVPPPSSDVTRSSSLRRQEPPSARAPSCGPFAPEAARNALNRRQVKVSRPQAACSLQDDEGASFSPSWRQKRELGRAFGDRCTKPR